MFHLSRLRTLFWIAFFNFLIPVFLNIVQLALIYNDSNLFHTIYVYEINTYVNIIGVLFATIWCSRTNRGWVREGEGSRGVEPMSSVLFGTRGDLEAAPSSTSSAGTAISQCTQCSSSGDSANTTKETPSYTSYHL